MSVFMSYWLRRNVSPNRATYEDDGELVTKCWATFAAMKGAVAFCARMLLRTPWVSRGPMWPRYVTVPLYARLGLKIPPRWALEPRSVCVTVFAFSAVTVAFESGSG